ncbi:S-layer homology domain-containing protein, partial [Collinsella ihumii]
AMAEDTGIEVLATDQSNVAGATVEYESSSTTFYYTGKGLGRVPVSVTDGAGVKHDVDLRDGDIKDGEFCYYYVEIGSGSIVRSNGTTVKYYDGKVKKDLRGTSVKDVDGNYTMPTDKGDYAVVIAQYKGGQWYLRGIADTFSIVGFSLNDAKLVDGKDVTDTVFEVSPLAGNNTGQAWVGRLGVAVGNHVLTITDDYSIRIVRKNDGVDMWSTVLQPGVTYQAVIDGTPEYEGHKVIDFQISKLDLTDASIIGKTLEDFWYGQDPASHDTFTGLIQKINNVDNADFDSAVINDSQFTIDLVSTPDGSEYDVYNPVKGVYTYKVTAKSGNPYFTGSKEFTVIYADMTVSVDFSGCGDDYDHDNVFYVNNSEDKPTYFDLSHIKVRPERDYTVTVTDDEGNVVDMAGKTQLTEPGTYYVKVDILSWGDDGKLTAGSDVAKVIVEYGSVYANTDIFMTYKGQNVVSSASDTYNGTDLSKNMAFTVKAGSKVLAQGTDYTVTFEKQAADGSRTVVDQIVDAGNYIITVDGVTFNESAEFTFRVDAVKPAYAIANWDIDADESVYPNVDGYLMYTGDALNPTFRFFDADGNEIEVPEGSYVVDHYEDEDGEEVELKEVGTYKAFFETAKDVENYDFDGVVSTDIVVTDKGVFMDVPMAGQWYSQVVYDAVNLGYMNGYSGTKFFGPNDSITRGQVACVLFNMAGGSDFYSENLFWNNDIQGYETGFGDVNAKAYYAQAIAWAKATGVVNGYGDGTFKPDQAVTREEFAAMLSNYAEKLGEDVDGAEADLSAFGDASQVSDWATEAVEWAVANEVMGNGGFIAPTATITRAEAAAMSVNYQPEKLADVVISVPDTNVTPR